LDGSGKIRSLGRRVSCHCLSVPALMVRLIAAKTAPKVFNERSRAGIAANPLMISSTREPAQRQTSSSPLNETTGSTSNSL
jgi:hypothetical protein